MKIKAKKLPASGKADREKRYDHAIVILSGLLKYSERLHLPIKGASVLCKKEGCRCNADLLLRDYEEGLKAALECLQDAQGGRK